MTWPKKYGGQERSFLERYVVTEEFRVANAPVRLHFVADRQSGPILLKYAPEHIKQDILPRICRGELCFVIGMSEPGSGSDLFAAKAKATKVDGGWRINGSKIWTSNAHIADYMIGLFRTSPPTKENRRHGLTQFLVDMKAPGITVNPIIQMTGQHDFNEVVFDDAFMPDDHVLGEIDGAWKQATSELAYERSGPERFLETFYVLIELIRALGPEPDLRSAEGLGRLVAQLHTLRRMSVSVAGMLQAGKEPVVEGSIVKDLGTIWEQKLPHRVRELAAFLEPEATNRSSLEEQLAFATTVAPKLTIQGGTTEILRGIIARGLGLALGARRARHRKNAVAEIGGGGRRLVRLARPARAHSGNHPEPSLCRQGLSGEPQRGRGAGPQGLSFGRRAAGAGRSRHPHHSRAIHAGRTRALRQSRRQGRRHSLLRLCRGAGRSRPAHAGRDRRHRAALRHGGERAQHRGLRQYRRRRCARPSARPWTRTPAPIRPKRALGKGQVSVISQSGGLGFAFFDRARPRNLAFRHIVTTGNEAALEVADVLDYMLDEGGTDVFLLLLEDVKSPEKFKRVAEKALKAGKPLIVGKIGQSEPGSRAVTSHTAALAGSQAAYRAIFEHYGLIEGRDFDEMIDIAAGFLACGDRLPAGKRIAICTSSGGAGVWMADACAAAGLDVPVLDDATRKRIDVHCPLTAPRRTRSIRPRKACTKLGYAAFARLAGAARR